MVVSEERYGKRNIKLDPYTTLVDEVLSLILENQYLNRLKIKNSYFNNLNLEIT
jgi:hypothetical protein